MAGQALRVLAVARKSVPSPQAGQDEAEHGLTFLGLVAMLDPPRPEVTAAVGACHRAGITIYMVTGDYGLTAEAVARRVGIIGAGPARVVTGAGLDALDDEALAAELGTFVGFPLVPLSALQVLAIDLGSDVLPALALGAERPEPGTMDRPPRPPAEHLFSWPVVRRFLFLGTIQSIGVVFAFFWRIHTAHLPYDAFTAANPPTGRHSP